MLLHTIRTTLRSSSIHKKSLLQSPLPCTQLLRPASTKPNESTKEHIYLRYADNLQYGIYAVSSGDITEVAIEEGRLAITRTLGSKDSKKKSSKVSVPKCEVPYTKKPVGTRMGKGKGKVSYWAVRMHAGDVIYEFDSPSHTNALKAFDGVRTKLGVSVALRKVPTEERKVLSVEEFERLRWREEHWNRWTT